MASARRSSGLTGLHVLGLFIGFFLIVFAVNGVMIYKATTTFGGLDTDDAYRKGLTYNQRIASAETQAALGWSDRITYVPETRHMRVTLADKAGDAVSGLEVSAGMERATTNEFDQTIALQPTGPGTYEADLHGFAAGWWTVDLSARRGQEAAAAYQARRRIWIKP